MASTEELKQLAEKAATDEAFMQALSDDPTAAAASMGITLDAEQADKIAGQLSEAEAAEGREGKFIVLTDVDIF